MVQINELIRNEEQLKILQYFIEHPTREVMQKELLRNLRLAKGTIIKWLDFLDKNELIRFRKVGLNKIYSLNNDNIFIRQLKILAVLLKLKEISKIKAKVFLYGSYARGDYLEDSDIDTLIIGKVTRQNVIKVIEPVSKKINKNINFQIFSEMEWSRMARKDPAFYERVEKDKIMI